MKRLPLILCLLIVMQFACDKKYKHVTLLAEYLNNDYWKIIQYTCNSYVQPEDSVFVEDVKNYKFEFNDPDLVKATNLLTNNTLNGKWHVADSALTIEFAVRLAVSGIWLADTITENRVTARAASYDPFSCSMVLAKFN